MTVKYKWVAERLELMIEKNIQNGIHKLPSEQELCTKYHVSRQTIRMALGLLEEKGFIVRKQGSGSFLTGHSSRPQGNVVGILISKTHFLNMASRARFLQRVIPSPENGRSCCSF